MRERKKTEKSKKVNVQSSNKPKFAKPGMNMQDANSKAMLENPSSRPNTEPQPTFAKTSVARTKSSHM